jgi:hypothetical protein
MGVAAREAGVCRLVDLEMFISSPDAPTPRMRQNYLSEQVFEWAGVGAAHLRATVFYENLEVLAGLSLAAQGTIRLPLGNDTTRVPLIAAEDVARVAVGRLTGPPTPAGASYPLVGIVISLREIIATFGRVLGRQIRYEEISDDEWRASALAGGFNPHAVEHLSSPWRLLRSFGDRRGAPAYDVTDAIEALGGARPKTFEAFLHERDHAAALPAQPPMTVKGRQGSSGVGGWGELEELDRGSADPARVVVGISGHAEGARHGQPAREPFGHPAFCEPHAELVGERPQETQRGSAHREAVADAIDQTPDQLRARVPEQAVEHVLAGHRTAPPEGACDVGDQLGLQTPHRQQVWNHECQAERAGGQGHRTGDGRCLPGGGAHQLLCPRARGRARRELGRHGDGADEVQDGARDSGSLGIPLVGVLT